MQYSPTYHHQDLKHNIQFISGWKKAEIDDNKSRAT